tara:strand:- start:686 stop:1099 length:414 start_codon:yes stop_codon:yes gene_type:complete
VSEDATPEWRVLAAASSLLVLDSLVFGVAPIGPWDDVGFSLGVIGLAGVAMGYVAWYRFNFKRKGLIPWIDLWEDPEQSAKKEMLAAILVLVLAWLVGNPFQPYLPDPTGLLLILVGLLMALQSGYVLLSVGPLKED